MTSRAKKILFLALAAALLALNGLLLPALNRERAVLGITRIEPLENAPPMLALTTQVLGGFRGLIANALWIRANQLQEEGKYFEMVQLADWITKLEPHITQVWLVQAWNMAFNISVKFSDYSDRWRWVQRGMELLRDDGLRYNPDQALIYAELAWLFQFKMGQNMDDGHVYYKGAWAKEMTDVFGGPKPDFERLINPQTPEEQRRSKLLREKYKMDPSRMRALNERYGPLDWRLPEAHAIYWAALGMERAKDEDLRRLRTAIYQSMNLSFQRGRLVINSNSVPRLLPNLDIAAKVNAAYEEQLANSPPNLTNGVSRAWRNFLRDVPYEFFIFNRVKEGEQWLRYARERFPNVIPAGMNLAEFVVMRATENATEQSQNKTIGLVYALVQQSYYFAAIEDNEEEAGEYMKRAEELWNAYMRRTGGNQRTELVPLSELKVQAAREMLAPDSGLTPEQKARLRTLVPNAAAAVTPAPQKKP